MRKFMHLSPIPVPEYQARLNEVRKPEKWATDIEIQYMAHLLRTNIHVYERQFFNDWQIFSGTHLQPTLHPSPQSIYLLNTNSNHFDVVLSTQVPIELDSSQHSIVPSLSPIVDPDPIKRKSESPSAFCHPFPKKQCLDNIYAFWNKYYVYHNVSPRCSLGREIYIEFVSSVMYKGESYDDFTLNSSYVEGLMSVYSRKKKGENTPQ